MPHNPRPPRTAPARSPRPASTAATAPPSTPGPTTSGPTTLAVDIGGTGLKASVLDPAGRLLTDRVRTPTTYPMKPEDLIRAITALVQPLPAYDRVSAGFPGMVRAGRVLSSPHFVTKAGPGTTVVPDLVRAWERFDLAGALAASLGRPVRVENDADLQGGGVVQGSGLELVLTLGTGMGSALYTEGVLAPHLELAHHPFRKDQTYDEQLGDATRRKIGNKKWRKRVSLAVATLHELLYYDHLYVGGGNAVHLKGDLGPKVSIVDNIAGITGGIRLWAR